MGMLIQVGTLDDADCISYHANILEKGKIQVILIPYKDK